jgi:HEAT repeat protein
MGHVFISYQSEDGEFVADMIRQIEDAGFSIWSDNERLRTGEGWREAIDQAIRDAFALIVILSPAASRSEQINYEATFALGVGVEVIVILRTSVKVPSRLESLPRLDFSPEVAPPWGKLIRVIQDAQNRDRRPVPFRSSRPGEPQRQPLFGRRPANSFGRSDPEHLDDWLSGIKGDEPDAVEKLIQALDSEDRDKRAAAASRLAEIEDRSAIPTLLRRLRDDDWRVREEAARALGKMKAPAAVVGLLECIRVGRPGPFGGGNCGSMFTDAIKEIGALAVPVLIDALSDEDSRLRLVIIDLLGEIAESDAIPALAGALRDPEWRVRWQAAEALGKMRTTAAVPDLLEMLADSNKDVRMSVAYALGRIGHPSAVEGLVKLLHDREWRVRWGAAEALWEIGDDATPALIEALREEDEYVRRAAIRALAQIGKLAIPRLINALQDDNWDVRWSAAAALQEIGDSAVPALVEALDTENWQAAWATAETLKRIGTKDALQAVEKWRKGREGDMPDGPTARADESPEIEQNTGPANPDEESES